MAILEHSFTIHHWPALQEWDVTPNEFDQPTTRFTAAGTDDSPGLLGALSHCLRLSRGSPAAIVIEAGDERYELHLVPPSAGEA